MLPKYPEFRRLDVEDAEIFKKYSRLAPDVMCEYSFANLMIWRDFDRPTFTFINDSLCLRIDPVDEGPFFLEPLGGREVNDAAMACIENTGRLSIVSADFVSSLKRADYCIKPLRDHFDYVYRVKDLAMLKGRKYDAKRNHIRKAMQVHPDYKYIPLKKSQRDEALGLFDVWRASRGCSQCVSELETCCQRRAIERAFEFYDEIGLLGGALVSNGELLGFTIGSAFNDDTACVHLLYTRPDVRGLFQTLLWEACKGTFSGFKHINLEQDLGIAGLKKNKLSYHPSRLVEKFEVTVAKK